MCAGVVLVEVVGIVGGDQRQSHLVGDVHGALETHALDFDVRVLNLHVEAVTEDFDVPFGELAGLVHFFGEDQLGEFAGRAAGEADQPFAVPLQQFLVDPRLVVKTFEVRGGRHLDEVVKAGLIHGQQREVRLGFLHLGRGFVRAMSWGDVGLVADDGLELVGSALVVEVHGPVDVAVVGHGDGVHAHAFDLLDEVANAIGPVQQAVLRVAVQVNERAVGCGGTHRCILVGVVDPSEGRELDRGRK